MGTANDHRTGLLALVLLAVTTGPLHAQETPEVGTFAYVVTRCSIDGERFTADQELRVQEGVGPARVLVRYPLQDLPVAEMSPFSLIVYRVICQYFGQDRAGGGAELAAPINRVVISPDGSRVAFHVTDDDVPLLNEFAGLVSLFPIDEATEGFYVATTDGSSVRFLGHEVAVPNVALDKNGSTNPIHWQRRGAGSVIFISPNGHLVSYVDWVPTPDGPRERELQVMTLDLDSGVRTQVTTLTTPPCSPLPGNLEVYFPQFVNDHTITFNRHVRRDPNAACDLALGNYTIEACRVRIDGRRLRCKTAPIPSGLPAQAVAPIGFSKGNRFIAAFEVGPAPEGSERASISELFVRRGRLFQQATNLGSPSTRLRFVSPIGRRIFFTSSRDPAGVNRCELFSIRPNGTGLQQITRFNELADTPDTAGRRGRGCESSDAPGCAIGRVIQDPRTRAMIFMSGCDLVGRNPWGEQVFAMSEDGTNVRQLTDTAGCVGHCKADGFDFATRVEQPGFLSYAPVQERPRR